jgi:hypothetical protein
MTTPDLTEILEAIEIVDTIPDAFGRIRALIYLLDGKPRALTVLR